MTRDKWLDLKQDVEEKFEVHDFKTVELEDLPDGQVQTLIFSSPLGKIKLEWTSKPKTLGEKTTYSRRIGSNTAVDKIYSKDERSEFMKAYKLDDDEWVEISAGDFGF